MFDADTVHARERYAAIFGACAGAVAALIVAAVLVLVIAYIAPVSCVCSVF